MDLRTPRRDVRPATHRARRRRRDFDIVGSGKVNDRMYRYHLGLQSSTGWSLRASLRSSFLPFQQALMPPEALTPPCERNSISPRIPSKYVTQLKQYPHTVCQYRVENRISGGLI